MGWGLLKGRQYRVVSRMVAQPEASRQSQVQRPEPQGRWELKSSPRTAHQVGRSRVCLEEGESFSLHNSTIILPSSDLS